MLIEKEALIERIYGPERPEIYDGMDEVEWIMKCIREAPDYYTKMGPVECTFYRNPIDLSKAEFVQDNNFPNKDGDGFTVLPPPREIIQEIKQVENSIKFNGENAKFLYKKLENK